MSLTYFVLFFIQSKLHAIFLLLLLLSLLLFLLLIYLSAFVLVFPKIFSVFFCSFTQMTFFPPHNSMYVFIYLICVHFPRWFHPQISQKFRREMKTTENINLLQFRYTVRFLFLSLCRRRRCFFFLYFFYIGGNVTRRSISNARENEKKTERYQNKAIVMCMRVQRFQLYTARCACAKAPHAIVYVSVLVRLCVCQCLSILVSKYENLEWDSMADSIHSLVHSNHYAASVYVYAVCICITFDKFCARAKCPIQHTVVFRLHEQISWTLNWLQFCISEFANNFPFDERTHSHRFECRRI